MNKIFLIIFILLTCSCIKNPSILNKPIYNYINKLYGYQIFCNDSSIMNNSSLADYITLEDSTGSVHIHTVSDYIDSSLIIKNKFLEYVNERSQVDCTAYGGCGVITHSKVQKSTKFINKHGVEIFMTYVLVKDSLIDTHECETHICGPNYYIELKNIKIESGFVDRAIYISGDSIITNQILDNFKYL